MSSLDEIYSPAAYEETFTLLDYCAHSSIED